jgi:hypothetical protein
VLQSATSSIKRALDSVASKEAPSASMVQEQPVPRTPRRRHPEGPVYIAAAITGKAWEDLAEAFTEVQAQAGRDKVQSPKKELHVTLWHKANRCQDQRVTSRAEIEMTAGKSLDVVVKGFDCAKDMAAARVELRGIGGGWKGERPYHVTMWHADGTKPVQAGYLYTKADQPDSGVKFLPIKKDLIVQAKVELR